MEEIIATLVQALSKDNSWQVRKTAADALGIIASDEATTALAVAMLTDDDDDVCLSAARALGRIGSPKAVKILMHAFHDPNPVVRQAAAEALHFIGEAATSALVAALSDEDANVRWAVVRALGSIATEEAIKAIARVLTSDSDVGVRQAAAEVLGYIAVTRAKKDNNWAKEKSALNL